MNNEEYLELVEKHPCLTNQGFGVDPVNGESFEAAREELKKSYRAFCYAWDFFQCQEEVRPGRAACHWKVDIENDLTAQKIDIYMPQGAVILAALYLGYKVRRIRGSVGGRIGKREEVMAA
jgi:hypothetical protein